MKIPETKGLDFDPSLYPTYNDYEGRLEKLIKKKDFIFLRKFTKKEVLSKDFYTNVINSFIAVRPFFNYMSDVLTTNLNGESTLRQ